MVVFVPYAPVACSDSRKYKTIRCKACFCMVIYPVYPPPGNINSVSFPDHAKGHIPFTKICPPCPSDPIHLRTLPRQYIACMCHEHLVFLALHRYLPLYLLCCPHFHPAIQNVCSQKAPGSHGCAQPTGMEVDDAGRAIPKFIGKYF